MCGSIITSDLGDILVSGSAFLPSTNIPKNFPSKFNSFSRSATVIDLSGLNVSYNPVSNNSEICFITNTFFLIIYIIISIIFNIISLVKYASCNSNYIIFEDSFSI